MTGIDERLERDLERAARPAAPDPGATLADVTRRRSHRTTLRKVQTVALVAVVLVGTAAGFAVLQRNFTGAAQPEATGSTSTPSPSTTGTTIVTPLPLPSDPTQVFTIDGLAFPVCRGSSIAGNFLGTGQTFAYVFTKASDGGCDTDTTVVAVQVPSDAAGGSSTLAVGGPLDCQDPATCFVWANPDIDGDGRDEIAIVSHQGASSFSFELYQARHPSDGWALDPLLDDTSLPASFPMGGSVTQTAGAFCQDDPTGGRQLVLWKATSSDASAYNVAETIYGLNGGTFGAQQLDPSTATADSLPPTDLSGCGGSIQNPTS